MLGKGGFVKRVNRGVDAVLEAGEQRQAAVYVRGQNGNLALVSLFGPQITQPFILATTDRRILLLAMGQLNAAHSALIYAVPRQYARMEGFTGKTLTMGFDTSNGPVSSTFHLVPAWKGEAAELAGAMGWATTR